jgi:hypothetical protein
MRKLAILGLLVLAGCQNTVGPFGYRPPMRADDPSLPVAEQERRVRDRYAIPDETRNFLPSTKSAPPGADILSR